MLAFDAEEEEHDQEGDTSDRKTRRRVSVNERGTISKIEHVLYVEAPSPRHFIRESATEKWADDGGNTEDHSHEPHIDGTLL